VRLQRVSTANRPGGGNHGVVVWRGDGLTFDEFGCGCIWRQLLATGECGCGDRGGGAVWLVSFARSLEKLESRHFWAFTVLLVVLAGFGVVLYTASDHLGNLVGPALHNLEVSSSP